MAWANQKWANKTWADQATQVVLVQSITGALTYAGVIANRKVFHVLTGVLNFVGTIKKLVHTILHQNVDLFVASLKRGIKTRVIGSLSFFGTIKKYVYKTFIGSVYFEGIRKGKPLKLVLGNVGFIGIIWNGLAYVYSIFASLNIYGNVVNTRIFKKVIGSLTTSGNIARNIIRKIVAGVSYVGTLTRQTALVIFQMVTGILPLNGNITRAITYKLVGISSFIGQSFKSVKLPNFIAGLSFSGITRKMRYLLSIGSISLSGAEIGKPFKNIVGSLSAQGIVNKFFTNLKLMANINFVGIQTRIKLLLKSITGSLSYIGNVKNLPRKLVLASVNPSGIIYKYSTRFVNGSINFLGQLYTILGKLFQGVINFTGELSFIRGFKQTLYGFTILSGNIIDSVTSKTMESILTFTQFIKIHRISVFFLNIIHGGISFSGITRWKRKFGRGIFVPVLSFRDRVSSIRLKSLIKIFKADTTDKKE